MFTTTVNPRFSETDALGHINNVSIAGYFEVGRVEFQHTLGRDYQQYGVRVPVVAASVLINYLHDIFFGSEVLIEVFPSRVGNSSYDLSCRLSQSGRRVAEGKTVMVYKSPETNKPAPIPEQMRALLEQQLQEPDNLRAS